MRLHPVSDDPHAVWAALPEALDGRRPIALGFAPGPDDTVPDDTAAVIATSGSSGVPKRVVLSAEALRASAVATERRIGSAQWMLALSAGYIAGLQVLVRSALAGNPPVFLEGRFTPDAFLQATAAMRHASRWHTSLVPAQLATLLDAAQERADVRTALAGYDTVLVGGQSLPVRLRERALDAGVRVVRTYGSSETSGGCVYDGEALDQVRIELVDGEVRIAGPMLATGYLGDPDLTARVFERNRIGIPWLRTGDTGEIVGNVLRITGRIDNVIISGGVNVSLDRVEQVVRSVPTLGDAVAVGVPDDRWGQACWIATAQRPFDDVALLAEVRERVQAELGAPARPARIVTLTHIPLLRSGKPDRARIRSLLADDALPPDGWS